MTKQRQIADADLLAAGRGSRLRPHTDATPKPLLPINGRPTLDFLLQQLSHAGIRQTTLVTHHLAEQIDDYLQKQTWPIATQTVRQHAMRGTADALLSAMPSDNPEPMLVSATDYIVDGQFYHDFVAFHNSHDCDISVSLKQLPEHELALRSSVQVDADMNISRIVEKPAAGEAPSSYSANLLFVVPANFRQFLLNVKPSVRGECEVQDAINAYLQQGGRARGLMQVEPDEWHPDFNKA